MTHGHKCKAWTFEQMVCPEHPYTHIPLLSASTAKFFYVGIFFSVFLFVVDVEQTTLTNRVKSVGGNHAYERVSVRYALAFIITMLLCNYFRYNMRHLGLEQPLRARCWRWQGNAIVIVMFYSRRTFGPINSSVGRTSLTDWDASRRSSVRS